MIALCHKCGSPKDNPINLCSACNTVPESDDDLALAFMLTDRFLDKPKLLAAAQMIRKGQKIELPPSVRAAVRAALQGARAQQQHSQQHVQGSGISTKGIVIVLAVIAAVVCVFYFGSVHVEKEAWRTSNGSRKIESLRQYLRSYSHGEHADEAKEQITELADAAWEEVSKSGSKTEIQKFLRDYPETTKIAAAEARIIEIADRQWQTISESRSITEIKKFLSAFPETSKTTDAEARIQALYNDVEWVMEQDDLEHYRRFTSRYPAHPQIAAIERRIIDLEVKEIAAGEYGEMPKAQALSYGGTSTAVEVENKTGYELTVRYSGPGSKKLVIPIGATRTIDLVPGAYQVAASVNAANVTNYYGSDTMQGGRYSSSFFIQSGYGGSAFSVPSYTPSRKGR